ncbi:MAG TPA: RuvA C-terminal domain-containing protein [Candidatus Angelobacter sp.]|nr:RuvA C-terminal domain-containing protein [Candidatus Angelobacter sp.]
MATAVNNPLFTRSEKRRGREKARKVIKSAARRGLSKMFGIPLSPGLGGGTRHTARGRRSSTSSAGVRGDVLSALRNLGYKQSDAEKMVPAASSGEGFDSLFRRSVARNPGELVIFGNPSRVYGREQVVRAAKRHGAARVKNSIPSAVIEGMSIGAGYALSSRIFGHNPIPAAVLSGLGWSVGETAGTAALTARGSRKLIRDATGRGGKRKRRNPGVMDQAKDLYQQFHRRAPGGVYELQVSAKKRKDYTILGPLVAIGINAEKYDRIRPTENQVVQSWDKLPRIDFLSAGQVEGVKRILDQPDQYLQDCPLLASSPNGRQLYVIASVDPGFETRFDSDPKKDFVDLGEATFIVYVAKKPHDPVEWVHVFGEDGGARPRLGYARLAREIFFIGGSYHVEAPGIIN